MAKPGERIDDCIDHYLRHPLFWDGLLIAATLIVNHYCKAFFCIRIGADTQINLLSNIIGTSVSLAGFILAALTIIVTFKSNLSAHSARAAKNPLELLFSTNNYTNIVRVFRHSIIELTAVFVVLYLAWVLKENLGDKVLFYCNIYGVLITCLSLIRSLFILFIVLKMDKKPDDQEEG